MARLRGRETQDALPISPIQRPLRVVASGTLFLTHTLSLPTHPGPSTAIRASAVTHTRGGSASTCLSILAQFPSVDAILVAPLGGNYEGKSIIHDLEKDGVSTQFCKIWIDSGVPSAWVLHADDTGTHSVINNNPLPDITHEEFVSLLGPLLAPENYAHLSPAIIPPSGTPPASNSGVRTCDTLQPRTSVSRAMPHNNNSPAPCDWIHFEGRSVKTTLSNITGLDGLARERKWRSHCVFSIDIGRRPKQGIEALIPQADVIFLNRHYARAHSPQYATAPRAFLLSLASLAPPHALLIAHWGSDGAAALSLPTQEYFQSSGWAAAPVPTNAPEVGRAVAAAHQEEMRSVRSGSDFWAGAGHHTQSSGEFTASALSSSRTGHETAPDDDAGSSDSESTQIAARGSSLQGIVADDVGAQDAFVAGMIYALSRRILPGDPFTPAAGRQEFVSGDRERDKGRWRLEECLRFATELAGRKAQRRGWDGLADEMAKAGWFEG